MTATSLPALGTVIVSAFIDSINPCAIGVMILLISLIVANAKLRSRMLRYGAIYIMAVFLTYLAAGLGLTVFFSSIPLWLAEYISIVVGSLIVLGGLVEIKDFFWYGRGISLSIPPERAKDIHRMTENVSGFGLIALGVFVAMVELPCTGGPYLAITMLLSQNFDLNSFLLLVLYNIIFVLPLVALLALAVLGGKVQEMKRWKQEARPYMRLFIGMLLVALGWLLMLIANGTVNLG